MPVPALKYLMQQLNVEPNKDFSKEWAKLSESDRSTLKLWADEEQVVLGL